MPRNDNATFHVASSPKETRFGYAFVASGCKCGQFHRMWGTFSAADITALGSDNSGKPGYAYQDDPKLGRIETGKTGRAFPVNKLVFKPEDDESTHTDISAGEQVIYYTQGEFITDQYDRDPSTGISGTGAAFGNYLKLTVSGWLCEESDPETETTSSVAVVVKHLTNSARSTQERLWYRLIT